LECYHRHKGENILRQIQNDHTFCSTCFGRLKRIDKPPQETIDKLKIHNGWESAQSLVGFQYTTPRVNYEHGFSFCECGNIDHYTDSDELRNVDLTDAITNLWSLLVEYHEKDQFGENKPDKEVLLEALEESDMDFKYAIGKAVYDT